MSRNVKPWKTALATLVMLGLAGLPVGCVNLPTMESSPFHHQEPPSQIITTWQPDVLQTQDSVNNGRALLGLGGRLYVFGKEIGKPLKIKGTVVVDLYDLSKTQSPDPVHLEQWTINAKVLEQFGKNDPLGFGYTLFLPWSTCRPEVDQVLLKIKFQPSRGGFPLYTETGPITINHPGAVAAASEMMSKEGGFSSPRQAKPGIGIQPSAPGHSEPASGGNVTPGNGLRQPLPQPGQTLPPPRTQPMENDLPAPFRSQPAGSGTLRGNPGGEVERAGYEETSGTGSRQGAIRIPVGSAPGRLAYPQSQEGASGVPVRPYIKQPPVTPPAVQQTGGAPPRPLYTPTQELTPRGLPLRNIGGN